MSWNTEAPAVEGTNLVILPRGIAFNPIAWTRKQTETDAAQNLSPIELDPTTGGTPVLNADGTIKRILGLADARVDKARGVVVCSTVSPADYQFGFPEGVWARTYKRGCGQLIASQPDLLGEFSNGTT